MYNISAYAFLGEFMKKIGTSDILILCDIGDKYTKFNHDIKELLVSNKPSSLFENLYKLSCCFTSVSNMNIKRFYDKYRDVFEIISYYDNVRTFLHNHYNKKNGVRDEDDLDYFYNYIKSHIDHMNDIKSLSIYISNLGFDFIYFDENADFTDSIYSIDANFDNNDKIVYLENLELVPTYYYDKINYRSNKSSYKIVVDKICLSDNFYSQTIYLNTLLFNMKRLPLEIDKSNIFDPVVQLRDNKELILKKFRNSIELGVALDNFYKDIDYIKTIVNEIEDSKLRNLLNLELLEIQRRFLSLKLLDKEYIDSLSKEDGIVNSNGIEEERKKYIKRRDKLIQ